MLLLSLSINIRRIFINQMGLALAVAYIDVFAIGRAIVWLGGRGHHKHFPYQFNQEHKNPQSEFKAVLQCIEQKFFHQEIMP
tara:strand:- start:49306 stop:49551 length:246 start_codon:yes stop_codon:yes gene_type:complete